MELVPSIQVVEFKDSYNLPTVMVDSSTDRKDKNKKIVPNYNSRMSIFMRMVNKPTFPWFIPPNQQMFSMS